MEHNSLPKLLSIVVPVFNEEEVLPSFHERLMEILKKINFKSEIIYVNDGSNDKTIQVLLEIGKKGENVCIMDLSRNFGKEVALTAGLDFVNGSAVVVIDADLQDPPELIVKFVDYWEKGYDVVYGQRLSRTGETILKKVTAYAFYRIIQWISLVKIPEDTGDFRLLSRRSLEALKGLREQNRFMKGLFTWIGYKQISVPYHRDQRYAGKTKWNFWKLWNFALEGITSFSIGPLKVASYVGAGIAFAAFLYALVIIYKTLLFGDPVAGYPSLMVAILFLGGIQLISIGIIGEYIGRTYNEVKQRPLYIIKDIYPSEYSNPGGEFNP